MGKKTYIGVNNVARKVKKAYIGVDGKARKIKKMYIGDANGKARCIFGGGFAYDKTLTYSSLAESANLSGGSRQGASNGKYVLFNSISQDHKTVYGYNTSLTAISAQKSYIPTYSGMGNIGKYILFAGGYTRPQSQGDTGRTTLMEAFDDSLTNSYITGALSYGCYNASCANLGSYVLVSGSNIDVFNSSLTRVTYISPTSANERPISSTSKYAFAFASIYGSKVLDVVDTSLTWSTKNLSYGRQVPNLASVGETYTLIAGGLYSGSNLTYVEAVNNSLTSSIITPLRLGQRFGAGISTPEFAIFGGGYTDNMPREVSNVDCYDLSLTHTVGPSLSQGRYYLAGVRFNDYAIFASGGSGNMTGVVDVYSL